MSTIGLKTDKFKTDNFLTFQKSVVQHVLANFDQPKDIVTLPKDLINPLPKLMKQMPTTKKLLKEFGIDDNTNVTNMSEDDKDMISTVNELIKHELKTFMSKRGILKNNITKLWGVVWGQCTDALKEDIIGIEEYETKLDDYDTLWLLQQVKQCSAGADKTQHEYLTILKAMKALFLCRQGKHESLENIMERLESNLQTVKLAALDSPILIPSRIS